MAKTPTHHSASKKTVEALTHEEAKRKNIPTAEYQSVLQKAEQDPVRVAYKREATGLDEEKTRRNSDLDPLSHGRLLPRVWAWASARVSRSSSLPPAARVC